MEIYKIIILMNLIFCFLGAWPNNSSQFRAQYPPQGGPPQQWGSGQRPPGPPGPPGQSPGQWDPNRYMPPGQQPPYTTNQPVIYF